jgi:hypothetical protein
MVGVALARGAATGWPPEVGSRCPTSMIKPTSRDRHNAQKTANGT